VSVMQTLTTWVPLSNLFGDGTLKLIWTAHSEAVCLMDHHRVCSSSSSGMSCAWMPFMAPPRPREASATIEASR